MLLYSAVLVLTLPYIISHESNIWGQCTFLEVFCSSTSPTLAKICRIWRFSIGILLNTSFTNSAYNNLLPMLIKYNASNINYILFRYKLMSLRGNNYYYCLHQMMHNKAVAVHNISSFSYTIHLIEKYVIVSVHQLPEMVCQPAIPVVTYFIMFKEICEQQRRSWNKWT
jgi:hypothetical protein